MKKLLLLIILLITISCGTQQNSRCDETESFDFSLDTELNEDMGAEEEMVTEEAMEEIIEEMEAEEIIEELEVEEVIEELEVEETSAYKIIETDVKSIETVEAQTIEDLQIQTYNTGQISYNKKDTMTTNEQSEIVLTISNELTFNEIIDTVESFNNSTHSETIRVSKKMTVTLIDPSGGVNFLIVSKNNTQYIEDGRNFSKWSWYVTPLKTGSNKLILSVDIHIDDTNKNIKTYDDDIVVVSNDSIIDVLINFYLTYWQWIIGTIILPFIIFIWKKRGKKKKD